VDKRLFGRLQDELTAAQSELKLKEEEVNLFSYLVFIIVSNIIIFIFRLTILMQIWEGFCF
jgi:hypothetical protein